MRKKIKEGGGGDLEQQAKEDLEQQAEKDRVVNEQIAADEMNKKNDVLMKNQQIFDEMMARDALAADPTKLMRREEERNKVQEAQNKMIAKLEEVKKKEVEERMAQMRSLRPLPLKEAIAISKKFENKKVNESKAREEEERKEAAARKAREEEEEEEEEEGEKEWKTRMADETSKRMTDINKELNNIKRGIIFNNGGQWPPHGGGGKEQRELSTPDSKGCKKTSKKEVLGKMRCIYKIPGDRKEYVKYKGKLITVKDYKMLNKKPRTGADKKPRKVADKKAKRPKKKST